MTYKMYLDDIRFPPDDNFVLVRSVRKAIDCIEKNGFPSFVSFDHDLGCLEWTDNVDLTGYDFAKWLCEQDMDNPWMLEKKFSWIVHSANPVGAENINCYLKNYMNYIEDKSNE